MSKFLVTYTIAGRKRELVITLASHEPTARSVARAIIADEFSEVDAPFGIGEVLTAEQALKRFGIADVKASVVTG